MLVDNLYTYDFEVAKHDWLVVFKEYDTGEYIKIHNDNDAVISFMEDVKPCIAGFNNKHYDNHILKGVMMGFTPEQIKSINDRIIVDGMSGWMLPELKEKTIFFNSFDLKDDTQTGTSLKSFEAHLGIPIRETEVDFDTEDVWSEEEIDLMFKYCTYDVDATELLLKIRMGYLENKVNLGAQKGIEPERALYMTNAKLTATFLEAKLPEKPRTDGRDYVYPGNLLREYIPEEVFKYFDRLHDKSIPDDQLTDIKLTIHIGECEITIGMGGIHGAIPTYIEEANENRTVRNKDAVSYYSNLMRVMSYISRNIPSPDLYSDTIDDRVEAKEAGDKKKANALKLVLVTTFGGMLNGNGSEAYNELYDPLMARSVCITGQLFLLELAEHLACEMETIRIIQLNTDGIMVSFDISEESKWLEITEEWQKRTGFVLEKDFIKKIVQRDVNSYIEIQVEGDIKLKGALVRGVLTNSNFDFKALGLHEWTNLSGGAFKINNDAVIVTKAVCEYFVNGTEPEVTIANDNDMLNYQLISKAGSTYKACFQKIGDELVPVQKVNRVYASPDYNLGTLFKQHKKHGRLEKIASIPEHCLIDNDNEYDINYVDKDWYVRLAWKHIREFQGIKIKRNTRRVNKIKKEILEQMEGILWQL